MSSFVQKLTYLLICVLFAAGIAPGIAFADENTVLDEQFALVNEYWESLRAGASVDEPSNMPSQITAVLKSADKIAVGISNINDDEFKNEILSLPGVSEALIEFVTFEIAWYGGFADKLPPHLAETPLAGSINSFNWVRDTVFKTFRNSSHVHSFKRQLIQTLEIERAKAAGTMR